jgi:hypothetical protein
MSEQSEIADAGNGTVLTDREKQLATDIRIAIMTGQLAVIKQATAASNKCILETIDVMHTMCTAGIPETEKKWYDESMWNYKHCIWNTTIGNNLESVTTHDVIQAKPLLAEEEALRKVKAYAKKALLAEEERLQEQQVQEAEAEEEALRKVKAYAKKALLAEEERLQEQKAQHEADAREALPANEQKLTELITDINQEHLTDAQMAQEKRALTIKNRAFAQIQQINWAGRLDRKARAESLWPQMHQMTVLKEAKHEKRMGEFNITRS